MIICVDARGRKKQRIGGRGELKWNPPIPEDRHAHSHTHTHPPTHAHTHTHTHTHAVGTVYMSLGEDNPMLLVSGTGSVLKLSFHLYGERKLGQHHCGLLKLSEQLCGVVKLS